ncbi:prepilin-type N-terminal cleavage/methylation domain-containing protein [Candidatus Berkelbacteria bacterium]|nr:prepilin-type N-terminal cleavage/methylation domain-containing protein [Candidatus Berkelbacteria bacterium]MBI4029629.1 prepilin-type N-terminal cleavage/methylation domain-containing protein [Candidatus Berkelbacteria bacterium]
MRFQKSFTLIELLISIFIISLLAGMVTVSTSKIRSRSRDNRRIADLKTIQGAVELYRADNNGYPTAFSALSPYLNPVPKDPKSGGYCYSYKDVNGVWVKGGEDTSNGASCTTFNQDLNNPLSALIKPSNYALRSRLEGTHSEAANDLSSGDSTTYDIGG